MIKEGPIVNVLAEAVIFINRINHEFNEKLLKKLKVRKIKIRVLFKILVHLCMWSLFEYYEKDLIPCIQK